MPEIPPQSEQPRTSPAQLRKIGVMGLLIGLILAGLIYIIWPDQGAPDENSATGQYYKYQNVDVQRLWGNEGSLVLAITRAFKRPGTYSVICIVLSVVFALACFYLANPSREAD